MPATRNEATPHVKPPKMTPSAELTIGTAMRPSRGRLRTVADGCERKRNVERTHPQPPDPQSETGSFATHSGKMCITLFNTIYLYILLNIVSSESFFLLKNYLQAACTSCRGVAHATISDPWWKLLGCWDEELPDVWAADCPFCLLSA